VRGSDNFVIQSYKHDLSRNTYIISVPVFQKNCHINVTTSYFYNMSLMQPKIGLLSYDILQQLMYPTMCSTLTVIF
jgi:hypothetical protein